MSAENSSGRDSCSVAFEVHVSSVTMDVEMSSQQDT